MMLCSESNATLFWWEDLQTGTPEPLRLVLFHHCPPVTLGYPGMSNSPSGTEIINGTRNQPPGWVLLRSVCAL